ncbi:transporter substrate-binding domain-containing protein [Miniphocaeibacter massiliensis]|uniref:transporter substrate-binding domain-containing protein n=1 Tax=Miniphocaeibacter massiliensis TaxID=2041841 RepID=UPI000C1BBA1F|nr:transporter substrate-binding domain-containing protein [Miniphocaeibacter massiliensis]
MKIKKICLMLLIMVVGIGIVGCNGKKDDSSTKGEDNKEGKTKIVVGTSASYKPWAFQENDELKGFEMEVWEEIAKRNNYDLDYKLGQFSGLIGMLDSGEIDTIAHQMSITPEREEKYAFSSPYAYSYYDLFVKEDSEFKTKEDLKGKKVGCWLGGNGEATLRAMNEKYNLGFEIITFDGAPMEEEVKIGRLDGLWQGEVKTNTVIEENGFPLRGLGDRETFEINAYPFRKDEKGEKMAKEVANTLEEMHKDGTLKKLSEKWFNLDVSSK